MRGRGCEVRANEELVSGLVVAEDRVFVKIVISPDASDATFGMPGTAVETNPHFLDVRLGIQGESNSGFVVEHAGMEHFRHLHS